MKLQLQPVRIAGLETGDGRLVFADNALVAVLIRLSEVQEEEAGRWFVEVTFGNLDGVGERTFEDPDAAGRWLTSRLDSTASH